MEVILKIRIYDINKVFKTFLGHSGLTILGKTENMWEK